MLQEEVIKNLKSFQTKVIIFLSVIIILLLSIIGGIGFVAFKGYQVYKAHKKDIESFKEKLHAIANPVETLKKPIDGGEKVIRRLFK